MTEFARDTWEWWQAALAAPSKIGTDEIPLPADADPYQGFYRMRTHKNGPFVPVRIWYAGDTLRCKRGEHEVEESVARGMWSYAARTPISYDHYESFMKTGVWHDEVKVGEGDKASSSHVGKPAAEKPKRAPRANPETAPKADPVQEKPVEEPSKDDPDADHRTPEQKAARHPNGHDRYDRFGNEVDDWGDIVKPAEQVRTEAIAQAGKDAAAQREAEDVQAAHEAEADDGEPAPMRYWHHNATDRIYASVEQPDISGIVVEISKDEYDAIAGTHADQGGLDLAAPEGDAQTPENELGEPANAGDAGDDVKAAEKPEKVDPPAPQGDGSAENERAVIGGNSGAAGDDFSTWKDEIDEWTREADKLQKAGTPKTEEEATKIADTKSKLGDLWKEGEAMRKAQKKPHDDAAAAVQTKFKPLLDKIVVRGDAMVSTLQPYLQEKQRIENERVEAENRAKREAAEREAKEAADFGDEPTETVVKETKARKVGVGNRRTVSTVTHKVPVIEDAEAAAAYFAKQNPLNPEFADLLRKLGGKVMKAAGEGAMPGMKLANSQTLR